MQILVTGGAGFIGANLVRHLVGRTGVSRVAVLDDQSTGTVDNLRGVERVDFFDGSILDSELLDAAIAGVSSICHLAARPSVPRSVADPIASHEANASGTLAVLEAARRHGNLHVVVASSSSVYGANPTLPKHEELRPAPMSPYAVSKLAAESYATAFGACYGLPTLPFRFFNVFGPLQAAGHAYAAVIPAFVSAALEERPIPIHGDGLQSRDFTYVGTVVEVLAEASIRRVTSPAPVNLAFGSRRTLLDVVRDLEDILGRRLAVAHGDPRPGDVRHSQADQARFRGLFAGVEAVPFKQGLRETVQWFEKTHL